MKMSSILLSLVLFAAVMMLSGCIFPYWGDEGYYGEGGGHRGGGHRDNGHHGGREHDD